MNTEYYKTQLKLLSRQATNDIPKASIAEAINKLIECCEFVLDRLEVQQNLLDILMQEVDYYDEAEYEEKCDMPPELKELFENITKLVENINKPKASP